MGVRRRRLRAAGIAILAIGLDIAFATYRIEMRQVDPRTDGVRTSMAAADRRQMGLLYGPAAAEMSGWVDALEAPAGHATLIGLVSAIAAIVCFRGAQLSRADDL